MNKLLNYLEIIVLLIAVLISLSSFLYFSQSQLNLDYGDAVSRLNISRKILDNLTPGLGQIGSIWLPLPFILMLPFIWIEPFWHSGIAGYIVSGISFIFTIVCLYKLGILAFNSRLSAIFMALTGLTSINFIYVQTTAMSESIFIATLTGSTYFLYKWSKNLQISTLITAAIFIAANTTVRYEGYFVFIASFFLVLIISYLKLKSRKIMEGNILIFATLASTGILIWFIYNWAIFGSPFHWIDSYTGQTSIISTETTETIAKTTTEHQHTLGKGNILTSIYYYWSSVAQMNGILLTTFTTIGLLVFLIQIFLKRNHKKIEYLALLIPIGSFIFVALALYRGFPLKMPELTIANLLTKETNILSEYNIRYGINMLPMLAIIVGWIMSKNIIVRVLTVIIFVLQLISPFITPMYNVYSLPVGLNGPNSSKHNGENPASIWLKTYYDGGLILISEQNHSPIMFSLGLDYKNYIHEGTRHYWSESIKTPHKYASWIFMYDINKPEADDDFVAINISKISNITDYYDLVYKDQGFEIYKIKSKPEIVLN